jgi:2'-5' RNA ligase
VTSEGLSARQDGDEARPLRLFVAAELPEPVLRAVEAASEDWRRRLGEGVGRWVATENQHVTIAFLGRTWPGQVDWVRARVREACRRVRAFDTGLSAYGVFPGRSRARLLWLGLDERGGGWDALASAVQGSLAEEFPPPARAYTPHLTLARFEPRVSFADHEAALGHAVAGPRFRIGAVTLFRSHLGRPRPRYEPLERFRLRG